MGTKVYKMKHCLEPVGTVGVMLKKTPDFRGPINGKHTEVRQSSMANGN